MTVEPITGVVFTDEDGDELEFEQWSDGDLVVHVNGGGTPTDQEGPRRLGRSVILRPDEVRKLRAFLCGDQS